MVKEVPAIEKYFIVGEENNLSESMEKAYEVCTKQMLKTKNFKKHKIIKFSGHHKRLRC